MRKNIYIFVGLLIVFTITSVQVANAGCTIFQHSNYEGASFTLNHLERIIMVKGRNSKCVTDAGRNCGSVVYEASWNDQVSSFTVTSGCTLTIWEHINEGGAKVIATKSFSYIGDRWNDQVSEAFCLCE